jgi:hypothetical protein
VVSWFKNKEILSRKTKIQRNEVQGGAGKCRDFLQPITGGGGTEFDEGIKARACRPSLGLKNLKPEPKPASGPLIGPGLARPERSWLYGLSGLGPGPGASLTVSLLPKDRTRIQAALSQISISLPHLQVKALSWSRVRRVTEESENNNASH